MVRFTLPRDLYHGKGALEALKTLKGKKAIICVGGGSMSVSDFFREQKIILRKLEWKLSYSRVSNQTLQLIQL